jgi:putative transposase
VLDILAQGGRGKASARKFFCRLLKGLPYEPRVIITNKLGSYSAVKVEARTIVVHLREKGSNNRTENSHPPTRLRSE